MEALREDSYLDWSENAEAWMQLRSCLHSHKMTPAFESAISELLNGLVHSVLVCLDGGSALADTTSVSLRDSTGTEFKRHLHEYWPLYGGADDT